MKIPCIVPPIGWICRRYANHDGPCAAFHISDEMVAEQMQQLREYVSYLVKKYANMDWQDMESAPLDGTPVLIAETKFVAEARYIEDDGWYLAQNDPTDSWGPGSLTPRKWMHLPKVPSE